MIIWNFSGDSTRRPEKRNGPRFMRPPPTESQKNPKKSKTTETSLKRTPEATGQSERDKRIIVVDSHEIQMSHRQWARWSRRSNERVRYCYIKTKTKKSFFFI